VPRTKIHSRWLDPCLTDQQIYIKISSFGVNYVVKTVAGKVKTACEPFLINHEARTANKGMQLLV
jgi:hypothetical protein